MNRTSRQSLLPAMGLLVAFLGISSRGLLADGATSSGEALFAHRILPLFRERCFACHGDNPAELKGGLNMKTREGLLRGGESGEASISLQNPDESPLFLAVLRSSELWSAMPPKENDRLNSEQVGDLTDWLDAGAPWPSDERIKELLKSTQDNWSPRGGVTVPTSGGLSDDWTNRSYDPQNLWAYQTLWTESEKLDDSLNIDKFINQKLKELGVNPAPLADRQTLIRRATFDLTGLPPTPQEIQAFLDDPADDTAAFSNVVERLLQSPHYGEQWGRHWLDVVRYADSSGFANDFERGNTWRYRDYVIRAFNQDRPYDQFIREQIAGDEIYEFQRSEGKVPSAELLVAAGFLRMGPWELTGMEVARIARQRFLDDVTDSVGQVFLGHMLQCARCHDHKFDPVPTRDYYSIQAIFQTTQFAERDAPFLKEENISGFEEAQYLEARRRHYEEQLRQLDQKQTLDAARKWYFDHNLDATPFEEAVQELVSKANQTGNRAEPTLTAVRNLMAKKKVHPDSIPPRHVGFGPEEFGLERVARKGLERLKWRMDRYEPIAFSVYQGGTPELKSIVQPQRMPAHPMDSGILEETCILIGGDPFSRGEPVRPGYLSVVSFNQGKPSPVESIPVPEHALRLELARWISSTSNPLAPRVIVNRLWQWHFGQSIAGNPNNFGATGKKPSHPELLDWLARRMIKQHWSIKEMHRIIMLSEAYRRSSTHPEPELLKQLDPLNISYARFSPRRLEAEELRDAMLSISGELNPALGGIPVRPEMNLEAALQPRMVMGTFAEAWQPSPLPSQRHRRSIYAQRIRGQRDPFLEVFNAPSPEISCEAREASTITPQVFSLFNSEATFDRALAWANRLLTQPVVNKNSAHRESVLRKAYIEAYGRQISSRELQLCLQHWQDMETRHAGLKFQKASYPLKVEREAVEENTGEKFRFVEPLEVYADFVPDLKPADVGPEVRGLAEVLLVMLNSNEFAYVY